MVEQSQNLSQSQNLNQSQADPSFSGLDKRIYDHWAANRPSYVQYLRQQNRLREEVGAAAEQHAQTYSNNRQAGLAADQADEMAREPWSLPENLQAEESPAA